MKCMSNECQGESKKEGMRRDEVRKEGKERDSRATRGYGSVSVHTAEQDE